jgi:septal ring factor EnvC (AmiA/AmiB activator)
MSFLRSILIGSALLCGGCEDQITIKKQTAEIHRLQAEKHLLQTERDQQNQSLAGCEKKLRNAEADIKNLTETLSKKKAGEEKNIDKKPTVKQKKKGKR